MDVTRPKPPSREAGVRAWNEGRDRGLLGWPKDGQPDNPYLAAIWRQGYNYGMQERLQAKYGDLIA